MDKRSKKWLALLVISITHLGYQGSIIQVAGLGGRLISEMNLTSGQLGQLCSVAYLAGAIFAIILGYLADRWDLVKVTSVALFVGIVGAVGRIFCTNFAMLFLCNFLIGVGLAALSSNGIKFIMSWFEPKMAGTAVGLFVFAAAIGGTSGTSTVSLFPSLKAAFVASAIVTTICGIVWMLFAKMPEGEETQKEQYEIAAIGKILKDKNLWIVVVGSILFFGANSTLNSFYVSALQIAKGTSEVTATMYCSAFQLMGLASCFILPVLLDKVGYMRPFYFILGILAGIFGIVGWMANGLAMGALYVGVAFGIGGGGAILRAVPGLMPSIDKKYLGTINGLLTLVGNLAMYVFPSYIISGVAGGNFSKIMLYSNICLIVCGVIFMVLPDYGVKAQSKKRA